MLYNTELIQRYLAAMVSQKMVKPCYEKATVVVVAVTIESTSILFCSEMRPWL